MHWVHKATRTVSFWRWSSELPPTIQTEDVLTDSNTILVCLSEECEILEWDRCLRLLLYLPWTIYLSPSPSSLSCRSHKAVGPLESRTPIAFLICKRSNNQNKHFKKERNSKSKKNAIAKSWSTQKSKHI